MIGPSSLPALGGYWTGRPHVHIVRHESQAERAFQNESLHKEAFGWILVRRLDDCGESAAAYVPPSVRLFEDYSAYITSAITLWVWSKQGLAKQEEWADPNRGHLIYDHQIQIELLEYGYMLHKSLVERASEISNYKAVLIARKDLTDLKMRMIEVSPFGEIRDLLQKGWNAMGLEIVREQIQENISVLENETKLAESARSERISIALTILFGLIAIPPFADSVIAPLWNALGIWRPENNEWSQLFFIGIAASLVICLVYGLMRYIISHTDSE